MCVPVLFGQFGLFQSEYLGCAPQEVFLDLVRGESLIFDLTGLNGRPDDDDASSRALWYLRNTADEQYVGRSLVNNRQQPLHLTTSIKLCDKFIWQIANVAGELFVWLLCIGWQCCLIEVC